MAGVDRMSRQIRRASPRRRVADVSEQAAREALQSKCIEKAAEIGACFVKLPGKQHVVIDGDVVVTVLPSDTPPHRFNIARDARHKRA